ncbi:NPC intracellular cholesterol transporter 2 homolog a-like [Hylaeus volcanicus]|uniref:NPC intracellular cholesterol transporter 2 homolog a-like n=1 Tax=Hylaeus volcanicus TaxID=313075 RepID=UPI0023B776BC|nr:NPC intracellular cholesterol transporter 2 homolog a-like [Hylaeus volcanicus]
MYRTITATFVLGLLALSISPICQALEITDCGSKVGKYTSVTLAGCDMTKPVCDLVRNTNASIHIEFTPDKDVKEVHAVVRGIIMDIPMPFPLSNADACKYSDSGIICPLAKDQSYHYMNTLPVLKSYPTLSVTVRWELRDENNEDIVCILIPAKIK